MQSACAATDNLPKIRAEHFGLLREICDQLAMAADRTADSILIASGRGTVEYVNPAFEEMTGFSGRELLGQNLNASGLHNAVTCSSLWTNLGSGNWFRGAVINRRKSGQLFWCSQTIDLIRDAAGIVTHRVSVMRDVTALEGQQEHAFHMKMARDLQQRYYDVTASLPGFDIAAAAYPADEIGGDYFDFIPQHDGSLYIVLADVAGHGIASALVMAELRASLRAYLTSSQDVSDLLKCLNRSLLDTLGPNRNATIFLGRIDPQRQSLEYASAGHVPGFLLRASGDIGTVLPSTGRPLGFFPNPQIDPRRLIPLTHGDTILLLTDGITESTNFNDAMFGTEGALDFVRCRRHNTADSLVHGLCRAACIFTGDARQWDDMAAIICKVQ